MSATTKPALRRSFRSAWDEIEYLYHQLLYWLYDAGRRDRGYQYAFRLQRLLDRHDPAAESLLGMDGRAVLAELEEEWETAADYRERAVAAMTKLLAGGHLASARLGPDDISDRLDLKAIDLWEVGRVDEALATLDRSEAFCQEHGLPFDGADIRADIRAERRPARRR